MRYHILQRQLAISLWAGRKTRAPRTRRCNNGERILFQSKNRSRSFTTSPDVACSTSDSASFGDTWSNDGRADPREQPSERLRGQRSDEPAGPSQLEHTERVQFLKVPWRGAVTWRVMLLWLFAYVIHPQWIIPLGLELLVGMDRADLSARGEALFHMVLDLGMLAFSAGILWVCLRKYKPRKLGWFRMKVWPAEWTIKVLLACVVAFPLAFFLGDFTQKLIPISETEIWNHLHLEQTLTSGDKVTKVLYFLVLSVCAPLWEEVIFRGFLMPALANYMPLLMSVVLSALIFACVHFSLQRFPVLVLLGLVFGSLYANSNNLLTAITAHSLWNMWVFLQFLLEAHPGVPV